MKGLFWIVLGALSWVFVPRADAAVVVEQQSPDIQTHQVLTYQGVGMREELNGPAGPSVSLVLPDENRILELYAYNRTFSEKPLGAAIGELGSMQRTMAQSTTLLDEQVKLEKLAMSRISGMDCQNYRIEWSAQVQSEQGRKKYRITDELCVSQSPGAIAARDAVRRHMQAIAEHFGEVIDFDSGELSIFDMGKMFFGVPSKKFNKSKAGLVGFALWEKIEVDFGGTLLEPMMRAAAKQEDLDDAEADEMADDMQEAMKMMQDPKFQARMEKAMKEAQTQMNDPTVQAQMRQFMSPDQQQNMRKGLENMRQNGVRVPVGSSGSSLRFTHEVTKIVVVPDAAERMEVPKDYAFKVKEMQIKASQDPDPNDGSGAISEAEVRRILEEARTGKKPSRASTDYPVVPKSAEPWMVFYREWEGVPYLWGGNTKSGVDCSGLSKNAYANVIPFTLPRTTALQRNAGPKVTLNHARPGDLVFFDTGFRHVGIYLSQNKFFHASSSKGVTISTLANPYWSKAYRYIVRPTIH